ncbi:interleukin-1 receptor-associated kinase 4 [Galendromus occidentalis]|uniref:Interleukin-1 receptor-associated kinase 4 n=1 Tax=Galendromus occidentalis TaxID=34638 RepID=A0AAJ6QVV3_9ACAR|nr:interleukin-1 receptor-associated kinase 4 [Galendromus occidentalis]
MSFLKKHFRRKKHSTGTTQSSGPIISGSDSYIEDFPVVSSMRDETTRSNNNSSSLIKKVIRASPKPQTAAPGQLSTLKLSPISRSQPPNQVSISILRSRLGELSGSVDPASSVRSLSGSVKTVAPERNSFGNELRHLDLKIRSSITNELDANNAWEALAGRLRHPDRPSDLLLTDIQLLNDEKKVKSPSEEILKTWSTTGRNRPRIQDLYDVLVDIKQLKIAQRLMREVTGTSISFDFATESGQVLMGSEVSTANFLNVPACLSNVYQICFNDMDTATDHFSHTSTAKIGEGNFGVVYKVRIDGEDMAVKFSKQDIKQIANEIEMLNTFDHPNVLSLYGIALGEGESFCLITRYMRNGSLQELLLKQPPVEWPLRFRILRDVAAGLEYVHSFNVEHRDVKPANILLDENMNAVLADFGTARKKFTDSTEVTQHYAGSLDYMAPEVRNGIVDLASDVFSFGVVALEIFTGLRVYDSSREGEHIRDHVKGKSSEEVCDSRIVRLSESVREDCFRDIISCVQKKRAFRPNMSYVHKQFELFLECVCDKETE